MRAPATDGLNVTSTVYDRARCDKAGIRRGNDEIGEIWSGYHKRVVKRSSATV